MTDEEEKLIREGYSDFVTLADRGIPHSRYVEKEQAELALQMAKRYAFLEQVLASDTNDILHLKCMAQNGIEELSSYIDEQLEKEE